MKTIPHTLSLLATVLLPLSASAQTPAPQQPTAKQLVSLVVAHQRTRGLTARGRMLITTPSSERRTLQILVKGRHEGNASEMLYLALYPQADKGRAVVIRKDGGDNVSGFIREPNGKTLNLTSERIKQPLFGSDITIEDLAEDFWTWPAPKLSGQDKVCHKDCYIVDCRPPKGLDASHAVVRAWISPETALPLRIESYLANGTLAKRTECRKLAKSGDHWGMEELTVESAAPGHRTNLDFSKGSRDIEVPATDFTPEGIAKSLQE
jgi:hypothetical protein